MTDQIYARDGQVHIRIATGYDFDHETCTPSEAREYAEQILAAVAECEQQAEAIRAACADGHDWGSESNGWRGGKAVSIRWCKRAGCLESEVLDGWAHFAGRLHIEPITGQQLDCYGPGCEHCGVEGLYRALRTTLNDAYDRLVAHLDTNGS